MSETFNDHFAAIGPKLAKEIQLNVNDRSHLDYLRGLPSDHQPFQLDTVDHDILLSKLNVYGTRGVENIWFKSYLNGHNQKCFVNECLSENRSLTYGIPQGTILGPLLF